VTSLCALYIALASLQQCLEKQADPVIRLKGRKAGQKTQSGKPIAIPSREEERKPENVRRLSVARILKSATQVNVHTITTTTIRRRIRRRRIRRRRRRRRRKRNFCPMLRLLSKTTKSTRSNLFCDTSNRSKSTRVSPQS
jgi:hypothetical protein